MKKTFPHFLSQITNYLMSTTSNGEYLQYALLNADVKQEIYE